jgi:addiction module RelB/DinJ family antitoxin
MKTILNVRVDKKLKDEAKKLAKEMGLPLSSVINGSLKKFVRDRELVYQEPLRPSKYLKKIIREYEEDRQHGRNIFGPFESAEEMLRHLNSDR